MAKLHIFVSADKFHSAFALNDYLQPSYNAAGEVVASKFMKEIGLLGFEPMAIEASFKEKVESVRKLIAGFPFEEAWSGLIEESLTANIAIAVYEPNIVSSPENAGIQYLGCYNYDDRVRENS
ncbi:MAG: hypothetical protein COA99_12020 [Moraxellaceae bacterium]|nr:MAG: hypothetical protein COA99_12020 [Moraxellaceae bacterium]